MSQWKKIHPVLPRIHLPSVRVTHKGESAWVKPRYHAKAKIIRLSVNITGGYVTATFPRDLQAWPIETITKYLQRDARWIVRQAKRISVSVPFEDNATVPVFGEEWHLEESPVNVPWYEEGVIYAPKRGFAKHVREVLNHLLLQYATAQVERYATMMDVDRGPVRVKALRAAWGMHNTRCDEITFDHNLVGAPKQTIDAIACHEVAHILEQNHSTEFWDHVYACMPYDVYQGAVECLRYDNDTGIRLRRMGCR